jgi:hypothetical protein
MVATCRLTKLIVSSSRGSTGTGDPPEVNPENNLDITIPA